MRLFLYFVKYIIARNKNALALGAPPRAILDGSAIASQELNL
jgi:hypothetical protein